MGLLKRVRLASSIKFIIHHATHECKALSLAFQQWEAKILEAFQEKTDGSNSSN